MLVALQTLISQTQEDKDLLSRILSSFLCEKDPDIQGFLRNRAVEFEGISKSRTYLLCDEEKMESGKIAVLGYIAIALKVLHIPEGISIRARREIDGFSGKTNGEPIKEVPCYLIGQLARNSCVDKSLLPGNQLLEEAYRIILSAIESVGGRYAMIECRTDDKLIAFYQRNDFEEFARIPDDDTPMVQMIRKMCD